MKLYHTEWCPECEVVRRKLAEKGIDYEHEIVADMRPFRKSVYKASGQYYVPVLVDGETVLTETEEIMNYLDTYATSAHEPGIASNSSLNS
jgi:glutathione S-transferase